MGGKPVMSARAIKAARTRELKRLMKDVAEFVEREARLGSRSSIDFSSLLPMLVSSSRRGSRATRLSLRPRLSRDRKHRRYQEGGNTDKHRDSPSPTLE
jgi:hypothetical protein